MKIAKEEQFNTCRKCGYFKSYIIKENGSEHIIELNRKKIIECEYACKRNNNYNSCNDFLNYKKYPKGLSISEVIEMQDKNKLCKQNFRNGLIKFLAWFIGVIIAFASAYIGYLNYLK
mgnify:CR=1 FL=1